MFKQIIIFLLLSQIVINSQLISFDIEPRNYDIRNQYVIGNVKFSLNSTDLCDIGVLNCSERLIIVMSLMGESMVTYDTQFSFYDIVSTSGNANEILNYESSIFPNEINGNCNASFSIAYDGVFTTNITSNQIVQAGSNPSIVVIKPVAKVSFVNLDFPDIVDLSTLDPVIFTLEFNCDILIKSLFLVFNTPQNDEIQFFVKENSIIHHQGPVTIFKLTYPFINQVGEFTIISVSYVLSNGYSGIFETIDLLSLSLPTTFSNKPSNPPNPLLPSPGSISYYISDVSVPLSWSPKTIYASINFGDYNETLESVFLFLHPTVNSGSSLIQYQKFPFPVKNNGASFNFSISTSQVESFNCYFIIYSIYFEENLNISCGSITVYSPYPQDETPPEIVSINIENSIQYLVTLELSDLESGISKVEVPNLITLYNNQKSGGSDQNCIFEFYLESSYNTTVPLLIYDFNHNLFEQTITLNSPYSAYNISSYHPIITYNAPDNIELDQPLANNLFISFQDQETCDYESLVSIQAVPILNNNYQNTVYLSNYQNIINGTACKGIIGDMFIYPQIRNVLNIDYQILSFVDHYFSVEIPYSSIINADIPYLKFQPVLLTDFSASTYNITSGEYITFSVDLNSISRLYYVGITLVGLNQRITFPLSNTVGTYYVGTWSKTTQIPTYANNGTWTMNVDYFTYPEENSTFTFSNILSKDFDAFLTINSIVDLLPPSVEYVDVSNFNARSEILVRVVDTKSGVKSISMTLTPNNITNIVDPFSYFSYYEEVLNPGNTSNINFICKFNIPQYAYSGQYWMFFTVTDYSGNTVQISPDNLMALDIEPTFVTVTNSGYDNVPPKVTELTFSSNSITSFPATVTASITVVDNLSGVNSFYLFLNGSENTWMSKKLTASNRVSGNSISGVYSITFTFTENMKPSNIYYANVQSLVDIAGNSIDFAFGYLNTVSVSNKKITINTATTGSTDLPQLTKLIVPTNLIDLASATVDTTIELTAIFSSSVPLQSLPDIVIQHSTQSFVPLITCQIVDISASPLSYICDVSNYPTGFYYIHVKSFGDQNGNYNSCYMCNSLLIVDTGKPMFGEYTHVPTRGGRAYFDVENFLNSTATKLLVNGIDCPGLQFESYNVVSCLISNGTGTLVIQGLSNGIYTNSLPFTYLPPHIETTTSVLPSGGDVIIFGDNFGNSVKQSDITVHIGALSCVPFSVNDTIIFCKLPSYTGVNTVYRDVFITVNGISSNNGASKFQYNDPPNTPCSPSNTCSGNGACISGVCLCKESWSGAACEQKTFNVPTNTNSSNPTVIITPNSTNEDISTLMTVSVVAFNEINPVNNKVVKTNLFTQWTYTQSSDSVSNNYLYKTTIGSANVTVLLQVFKTPSTIQFAGVDSNIPTNGMKYSINITSYPWISSSNIGQLVMKAEALTQIQDESFCSGMNKTETGNLATDGDNIRWLKISQGNFTIFGKFSNRAVIDGRPTIISNVLNGGEVSLGDQVSSSTLIGVNVPHFYRRLEIDPDFSVLINPDYENNSEQDHLCEKSDKKKWVIPVIATICSVVGVALIISAIFLFKRYRMNRLLTKSLSSRSN